MQSYFHVIKANLISVTWKRFKKKDTALKYLIAQFINNRKINRLLHTNMTYSDLYSDILSIQAFLSDAAQCRHLGNYKYSNNNEC